MRLLITKRVKIEVYAAVRDTDGCVDGKLCLHCKWHRGPPVWCPLHGPHCRPSQHDATCREAVSRVYNIDEHAAVLPAFKMRCSGVTRKCNKPAKGPALEVDVMFVLSNGMPLAVEVDGRIHKNSHTRRKDAKKALALHKCGVRLFRIDLSSSLTDQFDELRL